MLEDKITLFYREFDLPWFDMAKREVQNRQKKMKATRGQRRKTWYKF